MEYSFNIGIWNSVFAVPAEIVDRHIKLASKEQLKVILWVLRHNGESFSTEQLAKAVGIREENAEEAMEYWTETGIFISGNAAVAIQSGKTEDSTISSAGNPKPLENPAPVPQEALPSKLPKKRIIKPDGLHVAARINESRDLKMLMEETETSLGKTLSPALTSSLISMHDDYGLPVEVILMIVNYAKSVGKTGTSYIESVARDWSASQILSVADAERKLMELDKTALAWKKVERIIGIYHRSPTKKEESASYKWIYELEINEALISEAYERCVGNTGKLSIAYMDKILQGWSNKGYKTLEDIQKSEEKPEKTDKGYDISDMNLFGLLEE